MKKSFFLLTIAISVNSYAQITFGSSTNLGTVLFKDKVFDMENKNKNIQGSAYVYENFIDATIKDVDGFPKVRYNALKDDMEVQQNNNAYVIPREPAFSRIKIISTGETIVLEKFDYKGKPYEGYLFVISEKDPITVYKKERVEFKDFEKPRNSYAEETPARFIPQKIEFFIKTADGKIMELPKNKKKLIDLLPDKQANIEAYFKSNKVDFSNDKDVKKLFNSI
ncbi:hypothetical protein [Chryseobacterium sp. FH1]|uniref:hypothetical protein n=1 Tax=Chryseobacterium sp. FH1 TaxID=1233951 RepID=UPI0004E32EF4|nr:hypothetical protein [Chryseobacterium sp. FH1]KFC24054.1 hypothetical protein IO90_01735 [Chryseobacterium sp. FH1]